MKKVIYLEGGGDSKELHTRCREGFRKLLEKYCTNAYQKGRRYFDILSKLMPDVLKPHLPSFKRNIEILDEKLKGIPRPET